MDMITCYTRIRLLLHCRYKCNLHISKHISKMSAGLFLYGSLRQYPCRWVKTVKSIPTYYSRLKYEDDHNGTTWKYSPKTGITQNQSLIICANVRCTSRYYSRNIRRSKIVLYNVPLTQNIRCTPFIRSSNR